MKSKKTSVMPPKQNAGAASASAGKLLSKQASEKLKVPEKKAAVKKISRADTVSSKKNSKPASAASASKSKVAKKGSTPVKKKPGSAVKKKDTVKVAKTKTKNLLPQMSDVLSNEEDSKSDPGQSALMDVLGALPSDAEEKSTKLEFDDISPAVIKIEFKNNEQINL